MNPPVGPARGLAVDPALARPTTANAAPAVGLTLALAPRAPALARPPGANADPSGPASPNAAAGAAVTTTATPATRIAMPLAAAAAAAADGTTIAVIGAAAGARLPRPRPRGAVARSAASTSATSPSSVGGTTSRITCAMVGGVSMGSWLVVVSRSGRRGVVWAWRAVGRTYPVLLSPPLSQSCSLDTRARAIRSEVTWDGSTVSPFERI
jgi:hypothetical protein